jgi:predicted RNA methylase
MKWNRLRRTPTTRVVADTAAAIAALKRPRSAQRARNRRHRQMPHRRTAYELSESQVTTPQPVISLFWELMRKYRDRLDAVLDFGAGDCRFAVGGHFRRYVGIEIDGERARVAKPPVDGRLIQDCAFRHQGRNYAACIGNPPYTRHHDIEDRWKDETVRALERELRISLNRHCNLYLYFLCLGLLKTKDDGLVALIIPYEWVSRPSARAVRDYIRSQGWNVSVYRFQMPIFGRVLTTASISIIDKAHHDGDWRYYDITPAYEVVERGGVTTSTEGVLDYAQRGDAWALRGLSPGSQSVFTLTDGERIRAGLSRRDVVPCVTTLRHVPFSLRTLTDSAFEKHLVRAGRRCWLIRSCEARRSAALTAYLDAVPQSERQTQTCLAQNPWFNYLPHAVPQLLFGSGFTKHGPKVLVNSVGARAVGSVWGIHSQHRLPVRRLQAHLLSLDFEKRIVPHAKTLKKVEVRQLNSVLNAFLAGES